MPPSTQRPCATGSASVAARLSRGASALSSSHWQSQWHTGPDFACQGEKGLTLARCGQPVKYRLRPRLPEALKNRLAASDDDRGTEPRPARGRAPAVRHSGARARMASRGKDDPHERLQDSATGRRHVAVARRGYGDGRGPDDPMLRSDHRGAAAGHGAGRTCPARNRRRRERAAPTRRPKRSSEPSRTSSRLASKRPRPRRRSMNSWPGISISRPCLASSRRPRRGTTSTPKRLPRKAR